MIWTKLRSDDPKLSPMINYLIWKRDLNPRRFDHYHPRLGPTLGRLIDHPVSPTVPQTIIPSVTPTPGPTPSVPQTVEPTVPEPSTMLLAFLMGIWGIWSRKRLRSAANAGAI